VDCLCLTALLALVACVGPGLRANTRRRRRRAGWPRRTVRGGERGEEGAGASPAVRSPSSLSAELEPCWGIPATRRRDRHAGPAAQWPGVSRGW
jgi:hypothetical protein